ncbi:hypothetical protein P20429_2958 [Pseudoalteromonas sp. BSi20429]|nr:hypothetical protein P20429_2958 [Pseudoalteromonas sp. BSi20429]
MPTKIILNQGCPEKYFLSFIRLILNIAYQNTFAAGSTHY